MIFTTLRGRSNFKRVFAHGNACGSNGVVVHWAVNDAEHNRYGVAAKTTVGCAVIRNKVRRWAKELLRRWDGMLTPGHDVVVIARDSGAAWSYGGFTYHMANALAESGLAKHGLDTGEGA